MVRLHAMHKRRVPIPGATTLASMFTPTPKSGTAFAVEIDGELLVVTATHVWEWLFVPQNSDWMFLKLQAAIGSSDGSSDESAVIDLFTHSDDVTIERPDRIIPLPFGSCKMEYESARDIGMWRVPVSTANALRTAGLIPLQGLILDSTGLSASMCVLLGYPVVMEGVPNYAVNEDGGIISSHCGLVMVPLEHIPDPETVAGGAVASTSRSSGVFTGRLLANTYPGDCPMPIQSVNGFSGGPIFILDFTSAPYRCALTAVLSREPPTLDYVVGELTCDLFRTRNSAGGTDQT